MKGPKSSGRLGEASLPGKPANHPAGIPLCAKAMRRERKIHWDGFGRDTSLSGRAVSPKPPPSAHFADASGRRP